MSLWWPKRAYCFKGGYVTHVHIPIYEIVWGMNQVWQYGTLIWLKDTRHPEIMDKCKIFSMEFSRDFYQNKMFFPEFFLLSRNVMVKLSIFSLLSLPHVFCRSSWSVQAIPRILLCLGILVHVGVLQGDLRVYNMGNMLHLSSDETLLSFLRFNTHIMNICLELTVTHPLEILM